MGLVLKLSPGQVQSVKKKKEEEETTIGGVGILNINLSENLRVEKDVGDYLSQGSVTWAKSGLTPIFGTSSFSGL